MNHDKLVDELMSMMVTATPPPDLSAQADALLAKRSKDCSCGLLECTCAKDE